MTDTRAPVVQFLQALYAGCDGMVEYRALPSRARLFVAPGDVRALRTWMRAQNGQNIYLGVATRRDNTSGGGGNLLHLPALYCDLDGHGDKSALAAARQRLEACPIQPSLIVQSGGGLHVYWLLREPMDMTNPSERARAKDLMQRLAACLQADPSCAEPARVLRLPETRNYKYAPPREVSLECYPDDDARINPEDIDEWLPMLEPSSRLQQTNGGDPATHGPGKRNATLFALARSLKSLGRSYEEILAALRVYNERHCDPQHSNEEVARVCQSAWSQADRPGYEPHEPKSPEERAAYVLEAEIIRERSRRLARRVIDAEERPPGDDPEMWPLDTWLDEADVEIPWRIKDLMAAETRVLVAAQFKAGKTILVTNLLRSLVDGDSFLGKYDVTPITDGTIAALDFEMSPRQFKRWLKDQRIENRKQILAMCFRGKAASFNLLDPAIRKKWAERFRAREVRFLTLDCLRPIFDALGLDEHKDAGRFLVALDALCLEAGIRECWVVHHMGHGGERARGDSRLRDWPDVEVRLVRQDEDPASPRFMSAYGRDVDLPEARLDYDSITRRLTVAGGNRHNTRAEKDLVEVLRVLQNASAALSQRGVLSALKCGGSDLPEKRAISALNLGIRKKDIVAKNGAKGSILHQINPYREDTHVH